MNARGLDLDHLQKWKGGRETAVDYITVPGTHRLAAMLDRDDPFPKLGDPFPLGWHAILFPRIVRHSEIGPDGHPQRGDFLPPVPLPRRMFAGKRVAFHAELRVGDEVRRESVIDNIELKTGQTGQMVFVRVKTDIHCPRGLAVTEEQNIVYRDDPDPNAPPPQQQKAPEGKQWEKVITPDPVLLFRFSALTFNGHRIHYDLPYVTGVEKYPGLIVNGGLTTLFLFELAREHAPAPVKHFSSRNVKPLFVGRPLNVCGALAADKASVKLWVTNDEGALALMADARFD
jgi:3-methylfumaryl-CoA hydratase